MDGLSPLAALAVLAVALVPVVAASRRRSQAGKAATPTPTPDGTDKDAPTSPPNQIDAMRTAVKEIREDLSQYGTAVGVASSGLIAVTAWDTFGNLFPLPRPEMTRFAVGAAIATAIAIISSALLTATFFRARRRILVDSQFWWKTEDRAWQRLKAKALDAGELVLVQHKVRDVLVAEGIPAAADPHAFGRKLSEFERDALALRKQAAEERLQPEGSAAEAKRKEDEAERRLIRLREGLLYGCLLVVESRSAAIYRSGRTIVLASVTALSVACLFFLGSWSAGESERIVAFTTCLEAAPDAAAYDICTTLDPRTPIPAKEKPETPPNTIERLNECVATSPTPAVSPRLRDAALADCAGFDLAPTGAQTPG